MVRDPITVDADLTLQEFSDLQLRHAAYPVMARGAVVGLFGARSLDAVRRARWASVRVSERMQPLNQAILVGERDELPDAYLRLLEIDLRRALVLRHTELRGLLSLPDVERLAETRGSRQPGTRRPQHA